MSEDAWEAGHLVDALRALPLRERVSAWQQLTRDVFDATNAPAIDWGDDTELEDAGTTIDDELAFLALERRALEDMAVTAAQVARSAEASVRAFAAHHDRAVTRADALDADRWAEHPAGFTPGEFAGDDLAARAGVSAGTAAGWAETGQTLRSRHPNLWSLAGDGQVRVSTCEAVIDELRHLSPEDSARVEALFLSGRAVFAGPAAVRRRLRHLLDKLGLARPRNEVADADLHLSFSEVPEQPAHTELHVVLPADDAWRLQAAIEARADALTEEHRQLHTPGTPYRRQRARVDALIDLALGNIRFDPIVAITVPVRTSPITAIPDEWQNTAPTTVPPLGPMAFPCAGIVGSTPGAPLTTDGRPGSKSQTVRGGDVGAPVSLRTSATVSESADPVAAWSIADAALPTIGTVSAEALAALGSSLGARVRASLTDAASGVTTWSSSRTYRPGLAMRRFVEQRDQHCRFPGCMRPASFCDADHVTPHAEGGVTRPNNLQLLCRHHHRAKTFGGWAVALAADATAIWQSPTGQWYRTLPGDATAYPVTADEGLRAA